MRVLRVAASSFGLVGAALLCLVCECTGPRAVANEPAKAKFEIRRAETKAAEGLTPFMLPGREGKLYLHPTAELTGSDIAEAKITSEDPPHGPVIAFILTKRGVKKMEALTEMHIDKPIAFVLDGRVLSAPVVRQKISGRAQITGSYTKEVAERLVRSISSK